MLVKWPGTFTIFELVYYVLLTRLTTYRWLREVSFSFNRKTDATVRHRHCRYFFPTKDICGTFEQIIRIPCESRFPCHICRRTDRGCWSIWHKFAIWHHRDHLSAIRPFYFNVLVVSTSNGDMIFPSTCRQEKRHWKKDTTFFREKLKRTAAMNVESSTYSASLSENLLRLRWSCRARFGCSKFYPTNELVESTSVKSFDIGDNDDKTVACRNPAERIHCIGNLLWCQCNAYLAGTTNYEWLDLRTMKCEPYTTLISAFERKSTSGSVD